MKVDLRKLEPVQKSRVRITLSRNDYGQDLVEVRYGAAGLTIAADAVEVNDLRKLMADKPGAGPQRPVRSERGERAEE